MSDKSNRQLPVLPLRGVLVFPYMVIHLEAVFWYNKKQE